jgi:hypothetical protein
MYRFIPLAFAVAGLLTLAAPTAEAAKKKAGKSTKVVGTIKAVSTDGKKITVTVSGKKKKKNTTTDREIKITDTTKIKYRKDAKADGALKVGQFVALKTDKTNTDTAVKIVVGNAEKKKKKNTNQ